MRDDPPESSLPTAATVARRLVDLVASQIILYETFAVLEIERTFGVQFIQQARNGRHTIHLAVLREFWRMVGTTIVWDQDLRGWRRRKPHDALSGMED